MSTLTALPSHGPQAHNPKLPPHRHPLHRAPRAAAAMAIIAILKTVTMTLSLVDRLVDGREPALD